MDGVSPHLGSDVNLTRWGRAAVVVVLAVAALDWVGWATGIEGLTRVYPTWPPMRPWTALWLAGLGAAVLLQSGSPSRSRVWVGRGVTALVGALAVVVLTEYATGRAFGLDQVWFTDAVSTMRTPWPGRPTPQAASSILCLCAAVAMTRSDRRWIRVACSSEDSLFQAAQSGVTLIATVLSSSRGPDGPMPAGAGRSPGPRPCWRAGSATPAG